MPSSFKWTSSHKDDITGAVITYVKGHELYGDSVIVARVFSERVPEYRGGPKVIRHFAKVEDEDKEILWWDGKGHKSIKDAKAKAETWLREALEKQSARLSGLRRRKAKRQKRDSLGRFKKR